MSPTAQSRREKLISITYFTVIIAAFFLFMKYAFWMFSPFLFAFALGMILQKPINFVAKKTHIKKGAVAGVFLAVFFLAILAVMVGVGYNVFTEIVNFKNYMTAKLDDLPTLIRSLEAIALKIAAHLPVGNAQETVKTMFSKMIASADSGEEISGIIRLLGLSWGDISEKLSGSSLSISGIASPVISTAMQVPSKIVAFIIFIIASFFLTVGYDDLSNLAKNSMKKTTAAKFSTVKRITLSSLGKMAKSYAIIICVTFAELSVGLFILRLVGVYNGSYLLLVALSTALLDILPVFGTGTVIWPWAAYNLIIVHNYGMAIGLAIIYVVIFLVRQVLEPKLVGANLGIPPILTLMGMYIGLETIGFIGLFILPITIVIIKMLNEDGVIHIWGEKRELATEQTLPDQEFIKPVIKHISHTVRHHHGPSASVAHTDENAQKNEDSKTEQ